MRQTTAADTRGRPAGHAKPVPVYSGRRVVGTVDQGTFRKRVRSSRHQLRQPPAWAFDVDTLRQAAAAGAVRVVVEDTDTGTVFRATWDTLRRHGFEIDRGHGRQLVLTLDHWTTDNKPHQARLL